MFLHSRPGKCVICVGEVKIYFLISGDYALAAAKTPDRFSKNEDRYNQQRVLKLWILLNIYHFYEFDWNQLRFRWEGARTPPGGVGDFFVCALLFLGLFLFEIACNK